MTLLPTPTERLARARGDLRLGLPIVLRDDDGATLVLAVEGLQPGRLAAIRDLGPVQMALTGWRARTLKVQIYDGDIARIAVPEDATASWIRDAADPVSDLANPLRGPFRTIRDGSAALPALGLRLVKSAQLLPAVLTIRLKDLPTDLTVLDAATTDDLLDQATGHDDLVTGRVPLSLSGAGKVHVFRPHDGGEEHVAVEIGQPPRDKAVLVRLHSACFTGDVLGSLKCDCGPQLHAALTAMGNAGAGVLLYLNQEGRGIGLANKMRAYALQDQGFDTVDANHRLGFEDDERDFRTGADLLKSLGFTAVRLLTNNPAKVAMLEAQGITVAERVPLQAGRGPENSRYLDTKAKKSGHIF